MTACAPPQSPRPDLADPSAYSLARRLFYKRFSLRLEAVGIDPDDGFQDVMIGLIRRSRGRSAWNPERGGLSTWMFVAMSGIVINLADAARRRILPRDGPTTVDDVEAPTAVRATPTMLADIAADMDMPVEVLAALVSGDDPGIAASRAGMNPRDVVALLDALGVDAERKAGGKGRLSRCENGPPSPRAHASRGSRATAEKKSEFGG